MLKNLIKGEFFFHPGCLEIPWTEIQLSARQTLKKEKKIASGKVNTLFLPHIFINLIIIYYVEYSRQSHQNHR